LKALGVAEAAIKRRKTLGSADYGLGIDTYIPVDGMHDEQGFDWGGSGPPSAAKQTPSPSIKPTP